MDFGKVNDIDNIDFGLNSFWITIFPFKVAANSLEIFIGPPVWGNKEWLGKIYPYNAKEADFLSHYATQFNCIELNVTHYQLPTDKMIDKWKNSVHESFKFCPKFPQEISHERFLVGCESITATFFAQIRKLENNLGVSFLQLPPTFSISQEKTLFDYLETLPKDIEVSIEFRHPSWFESSAKWNKIVNKLAELNVGLVITDVAGRRDVAHMSLSNTTLTVRFVGNDLHKTDFERTHFWVQRIIELHNLGLQKAYIFIHCGENQKAPELTNFWIDELNQNLNLNLKKATIQPQVVQGVLF